MKTLENPIELFANWYKEAKENPGVKDPTVMTVATATADGQPSARILLLKDFSDKGFSFFTNLTSRKAGELNANPKAAICFYWEALGKQVRIEGSIEKVTEKEADDYFASRARGSQISAWSSKQSSILEDRKEFTDRIEKITKDFADTKDIPRPIFWSGYRLVPEKIEFWIEGEFRRHDRCRYTKLSNGWKHESLYP